MPRKHFRLNSMRMDQEQVWVWSHLQTMRDDNLTSLRMDLESCPTPYNSIDAIHRRISDHLPWGCAAEIDNDEVVLYQYRKLRPRHKPQPLKYVHPSIGENSSYRPLFEEAASLAMKVYKDRVIVIERPEFMNARLTTIASSLRNLLIAHQNQSPVTYGSRRDSRQLPRLTIRVSKGTIIFDYLNVEGDAVLDTHHL